MAKKNMSNKKVARAFDILNAPPTPLALAERLSSAGGDKLADLANAIFARRAEIGSFRCLDDFSSVAFADPAHYTASFLSALRYLDITCSASVSDKYRVSPFLFFILLKASFWNDHSGRVSNSGNLQFKHISLLVIPIMS